MTAAMPLVAGVDSSTQSCKVVVADADTGVIVRSGRAAHPDGTEVDPQAWWDALLAAIADAGGLDDVAAFAVGAQQHGMVCLDASGRVVRPALLWNDTRSAGAAADLVAELGSGSPEAGRRAWAEAVGLVPVASFTVSKLRWLAVNEPANAERTAAVCLPHDWLTWRLAGSTSLDDLITDRSDASGTGYWSPVTGEYRTDLVKLALGHDVHLPRVLAPAEPALPDRRGSAALRPDGAMLRPDGAVPDSGDAVPGGDGAGPTGLGDAVPGLGVGDVVLGPGAGDNAAAALGLGARQGDVVLSIGTSGVACAVAAAPVADPSGTVAGFADATGRFLPLVCTLNAARVLDAVTNLLGVSHEELSRLALSARPGAGGLVLVPYLEGERTPDRPDATGALHGMRMANSTPAHLARAAVEGLLCGLADALDAIESVGAPVERVLLIGGGARSEAVRRIAPAVLGRPVLAPSPGEYVAHGAARQAAWALSGSTEPPDWGRADVATYDADPVPAVRDRYAQARDLTVNGEHSSSSS